MHLFIAFIFIEIATLYRSLLNCFCFRRMMWLYLLNPLKLPTRWYPREYALATLVPAQNLYVGFWIPFPVTPHYFWLECGPHCEFSKLSTYAAQFCIFSLLDSTLLRVYSTGMFLHHIPDRERISVSDQSRTTVDSRWTFLFIKYISTGGWSVPPGEETWLRIV